MIRVLIVTHGKMAEGMIGSMKMLIGDSEKLDFVTFTEEMGQDELEEELGKKIINVSNENQYLIMCDIKGGTPFNVASRYSFKNDNVSVFYGINLPILIETIISSEGKTLMEFTQYLQKISATTLGISEI